MLFFQDSLTQLDAWFATQGYWVFFAALALENVVFTSVIVPGLLVLILGGFYAGIERFPFPIFLALCIAGVWSGDTVNYILGRFFWARIIKRTRAERLVSRVHPVLERRASVFFVLYHFEPIARMVGALAAGVTRVSFWRWLPFDFLGGALWVSFYGSIGFALGRLGRDMDEWVQFRPVQLAAAVLLLVWFFLVSRAIRSVLSLQDAPSPTYR